MNISQNMPVIILSWARRKSFMDKYACFCASKKSLILIEGVWVYLPVAGLLVERHQCSLKPKYKVVFGNFNELEALALIWNSGRGTWWRSILASWKWDFSHICVQIVILRCSEYWPFLCGFYNHMTLLAPIIHIKFKLVCVSGKSGHHRGH